MKITLWPVIISALSLAVYSCKSPALRPVACKQYEMTASQVPQIDSTIYRMTDAYRQQLVSEMSELVVKSSMPLDKGLPESKLGNYVSDVCLAAGNKTAQELHINQADFIVLNIGGLRKSLPKGDITVGDYYEVMPFENQLVILELKGSQVSDLLDLIANRGGTPVAGVSFKIDKLKKVATNVVIKGLPLDTNAVYQVMTADYLANGGDQYTVFTTTKSRKETGLKIRDALIDDAREKGKNGIELQIQTDGRITYAE